MKASGLITVAIIAVLALALVSPGTITNLLNPTPLDGESITIQGTLELASNPPTGQIVLPVMVWSVQTYTFRVDMPQFFYAGLESNLYYLTRDAHVIVSLSGYSVGDEVKVTGTISHVSDVNGNQLLYLEYVSLEKVP